MALHLRQCNTNQTARAHPTLKDGKFVTLRPPVVLNLAMTFQVSGRIGVDDPAG